MGWKVVVVVVVGAWQKQPQSRGGSGFTTTYVCGCGSLGGFVDGAGGPLTFPCVVCVCVCGAWCVVVVWWWCGGGVVVVCVVVCVCVWGGSFDAPLIVIVCARSRCFFLLCVYYIVFRGDDRTNPSLYHLTVPSNPN